MLKISSDYKSSVTAYSAAEQAEDVSVEELSNFVHEVLAQLKGADFSSEVLQYKLKIPADAYGTQPRLTDVDGFAELDALCQKQNINLDINIGDVRDMRPLTIVFGDLSGTYLNIQIDPEKAYTPRTHPIIPPGPITDLS